MPGAAPTGNGDLMRDVAYAQRGGVELLADIRLPTTAEASPAILLVHGGSWTRGSRRRMERIAVRAVKHGFVAVNIEYRLAPEHQYPAPLEDVLAAVCWVRRNADRLHVDPQRIALWGYSAGAHLSVLAASRPESANPNDDCPAKLARVQACILGSTPADLRRLGDVRTVRHFLGGSPSEIAQVYEAASPILAVDSENPPTFLYHGRADWVVDIEHSRELRNALEAAGVPVQLVETNRGHFSQALFPEEAIEHALDFLDLWLKPLPAHGTDRDPATELTETAPGAIRR